MPTPHNERSSTLTRVVILTGPDFMLILMWDINLIEETEFPEATIDCNRQVIKSGKVL
jgi:hypothetical protein